MNISNVKVGMKVKVNNLKDAIVWTVVEKKGFNVSLQENGFAPQWIDCCVLIPIKRAK